MVISKNQFRKLDQYITSETNPKFFVHFSFVKRFGLNMRSTDKTPWGFYCYPLTEKIYDKIINNKIEFAGNRPYILLFSINNSIKDMNSYTKQDLRTDCLKLQTMFQLTNKQFEKKYKYAAENALKKTPVGILWNLTRLFAKMDSKKWRKIFIDLGYEGLSDNGLDVIFAGEPIQAIIFNTNNIIPIDIILNPNVSSGTNELYGSDKHERNELNKHIQQKNINYILSGNDTQNENDYFFNKDYSSEILKYFMGNTHRFIDFVKDTADSSLLRKDLKDILSDKQIDDVYKMIINSDVDLWYMSHSKLVLAALLNLITSSDFNQIMFRQFAKNNYDFMVTNMESFLKTNKDMAKTKILLSVIKSSENNIEKIIRSNFMYIMNEKDMIKFLGLIFNNQPSPEEFMYNKYVIKYNQHIKDS